MTLWCLLLLEHTTSHTHSVTHAHSSFSNILPPAGTLFQCSRSCGSGIQKRELRCGERDSQGGYVPSTVHQGIPHTLTDLHRYLRPHCVICVLSSEWEFKMGKLCRTSHFEPTCPLLHRYVEFPIRRCRNMAKPLVDLQQGCNRGPCPELPRVISGRTTSTAVVLGWYSSPWQQVHVMIWSKTVYVRNI